MTIHELFEALYADQNDTTPEVVQSCRLSNGSYNNLPIARAFAISVQVLKQIKAKKCGLLGI